MIETGDENTRKLRGFSKKQMQQLIFNYVHYLFQFPLEGRLRQGFYEIVDFVSCLLMHRLLTLLN